MTIEVLTPPGRIVWGRPGVAQLKTDKNKLPVMRDGKQVEQWVFGFAIPKADFNAGLWPQMTQEAATLYPQGTPPQFSWKIKDGDGIDSKGKPYNQREGFAGCFVLTVSTEAFAPPIYKFENGKYRQLDAHEIKCGDYAVLKLNMKANKPNDPTHTPGLYVNPVAIELIGYGAEIVSAQTDPDEVFGGRTYQLPQGASATPIAPAGGTAPYGAPAQPPVAYPPQQPAPYGAPAQPPQAPVYQAPAQPQGHLPPPAPDFVQNAGMPGYAQQPAPMGNVPYAPQGMNPAPLNAPAIGGHPVPPIAYPSNPAPVQGVGYSATPYAGMPGVPPGR